MEGGVGKDNLINWMPPTPPLLSTARIREKHILPFIIVYAQSPTTAVSGGISDDPGVIFWPGIRAMVNWKKNDHIDDKNPERPYVSRMFSPR